jgi:S1-C subfamily serine protease
MFIKKKVIAGIASVVLAAGMTISFVGCGGLFGRTADDNFAYDAAVENGYTGSESDWMASLETPSTHERKLYDEAVKNGYEGTFFDFLKSLNAGSDSDENAVNNALRSVVCVEASFQLGSVRGSGVIYSLDSATGSAYIVTNYHVVYSADERQVSRNITVYVYGTNSLDGKINARAIPAKFYGGAMAYDVAVLEVTDSEYLKENVQAAPVTVADSDSITVGERVYALGNPNGEGFSVSGGVVSVVAERINVLSADETSMLSLLEIRTDAAVNHGNSGGGLFNARGEIIGIVNARRESTPDKVVLNGFGYAIPANLVFPLVQNILDNRGSAYVARLGIVAGIADSKGIYNEDTGKYYIEQKITVNSVSPDGAGFAIGLQYGDTLLQAKLISADGSVQTVACISLHALTNLLFDARVGDTLELQFSRSDVIRTVSVDFGTRKYFTLVS